MSRLHRQKLLKRRRAEREPGVLERAESAPELQNVTPLPEHVPAPARKRSSTRKRKTTKRAKRSRSKLDVAVS